MEAMTSIFTATEGGNDRVAATLYQGSPENRIKRIKVDQLIDSYFPSICLSEEFIIRRRLTG